MNRRFRHGLVVGKFYPLHAGHATLIRAAAARCNRVTVEVIGASTESIPVSIRADWVMAEHPTVRVAKQVDDTEIDFDSPAAWDHQVGVIERLLEPADGAVDAVFTSDGYGDELAHRLGAAWVRIDPARTTTPVSGTAIRSDVPGHWWALPAPVRGYLARRVVVLGAESTGTTTLAVALAQHYQTLCVPEYGREWSAIRPGGLTAPWHTSEFDLIAAEQARQEDDAAARAPVPVVVADTDVLATSIWYERYLGRRSSSLERLAATRVPDLHILTDCDIPFVDDGMRDAEHLRQWMTRRFQVALTSQGARWCQVSGTHQQRLARSIQEVDRLLDHGWNLAPSLEQQQAIHRAHDRLRS